MNHAIKTALWVAGLGGAAYVAYRLASGKGSVFTSGASKPKPQGASGGSSGATVGSVVTSLGTAAIGAAPGIISAIGNWAHTGDSTGGGSSSGTPTTTSVAPAANYGGGDLVSLPGFSGDFSGGGSSDFGSGFGSDSGPLDVGLG